MAEVAVAGALVLVEIVSVLLDNLNLKIDIKNDVKNIKDWLSSMKAFLEDHDHGRHSGPGKLEYDQVQVRKVRDAAYEIEDVLDDLIFHSPSYKFHRMKITSKVHRSVHNVYYRLPHREIHKRIRTIRERLLEIKLQNETFSSNPGPSSSSGAGIPRPVISPLLLDDEMIGYDGPKKDFVAQLLSNEKNLLILAVVGQGGSGKTAFVKNVFWKRRTYGKFDCHAWLHVSRHFEEEELFKNMLQQFCSSRKEPCPSNDGLDPVRKLGDYLAGKRYIVVLDDIWGNEGWEEIIKNAFPNTLRGSRVIVTTRSSEVATKCASSRNHEYSLSGLEYSEGWRLFCRKAFPESNGECPCDLKDCSVRIVKRCEGLPLALVAVGVALSQKRKLPNEWEKFHNNFGSEIRDGSELSGISHALLPGYIDLSSNLKSCFLYFSIFPEDYSVERGRLIRLWVAERFAQETDSKTAEEVAEGYLNELIRRNLVLVSRWDFDGRPRSCRVQNLVLQFITQKCKDENFASVFPKRNTSQTLKIRRLCVHNDYADFPKEGDFDRVRSMFLLRLNNKSPIGFEKNLRDFKLLITLDLQGAPLTEFSKDITRLVLLRYLSFNDTQIKTIPNSIKRLFYLETLDLKQTDVKELPEEVSHLHNLCHLFAYKYNVENYVEFDSVRGVKVSGNISKLTKLQDFSLVEVDKNGGILKALKCLIELRKLGLMGLKGKHGKDLAAAIEKMQKLTTLDLSSATKEEPLELGDLRDPPRTIERLYLKGCLKKLPVWIESLNNLLRIGLKWSKMQESPLGALGLLPNLMELQLVDCYVGEELQFEASWFKKLKILLIEDFCELHTVIMEVGAMPELKQISLRKCPKMRMLPLGLENLRKVEEVFMYDMDKELIA